LQEEGKGSIIKFVQDFSVQKALHHREEKRELQETLEANRRKYLHYKKHRAPYAIYIMQELKRESERIKAQLANLPDYKQMRDDEEVAKDVMELILWVTEQLNINKNMSAEQVASCAHMIIEEFPSLYLEELALILKNALAGKYGEIYDRIDTNIMLKWIRAYQKEKSELGKERNESQHASTKPDAQEDRNSRKAEPEKIDPTEFFSNK